MLLKLNNVISNKYIILIDVQIHTRSSVDIDAYVELSWMKQWRSIHKNGRLHGTRQRLLWFALPFTIILTVLRNVGKKYKNFSGIDDPSSTPIQSLHSIISNTAALHKKEDFKEDVILCYRTDYSDDAKWKRLLELADDPNVGWKGRHSHNVRCACKPFKGTDFMRVIEGRQYENMTFQELQPISQYSYFIADKQSMEDGTFMVVHNDSVWEKIEETGQPNRIGRVLKSGRYPASEIWIPASSFLDGRSWDEVMPYSPCYPISMATTARTLPKL